jgi:hypothetical protein
MAQGIEKRYGEEVDRTTIFDWTDFIGMGMGREDLPKCGSCRGKGRWGGNRVWGGVFVW